MKETHRYSNALSDHFLEPSPCSGLDVAVYAVSVGLLVVSFALPDEHLTIADDDVVTFQSGALSACDMFSCRKGKFYCHGLVFMTRQSTGKGIYS